jgi:hypothetical protein
VTENGERGAGPRSIQSHHSGLPGVAHWSPKPFGFRYVWCDGIRCPAPAEHEQALAEDTWTESR